MPFHEFQFDLGGFVYTLKFAAPTRAEADAEMRRLLSTSSFPTWVDKLLPIDEEEIGSMH